MNVIIVGGGKIGRNLAMFLTAEGRHAITLVEKQETGGAFADAHAPRYPGDRRGWV
jgi:glycine/D-amino acid oxidase-like deaminating enzyme